ncbi:uncharacterized protein LOC121430264 isoform X2 [Lytechinus variegatus]|uniref:uncharacterized protein LOC121430264 isoform X2 n=1 Tax=Lytechinus variegatus TaxID=7654 RepID=UPI001BB2A805|nr:uncharacterized protein LOC121430264 isoform X2 [Lytechinus variegatus]
MKYILRIYFEKFFDKTLAHHNASTSHPSSPRSLRNESPTDPKKTRTLEDFHDDSAFDEQADDQQDDDDDDDDGSSSTSSKEGFVKRRIERWERRLSQCDDNDVTQGQASLELRQRGQPAPVVIPPTFLHGSVSFRGNSQAESELSSIRLNVIQMKADFQMTELKLKFGKWQYDVNKGTNQTVRPQKTPQPNRPSDNTSLPDVPESMATRGRGDVIPSVAQHISLASFGNDGSRRGTSGHQLPVDQRILSSYRGQNPHITMSQSTPSLGPHGGQSKVSTTTKTNRTIVTTQSQPTNSCGLEEMALKLRNMNKPLEQEQSSPRRTLVAPLKSFTDNQHISDRLRGSSGIDPSGYQKEHRQDGRSGTSNMRTSHTVPSHGTVTQSGIPVRKTATEDYQHRSGRSEPSNMQMSNIPSHRTIIQSGVPVRMYKAAPDDYRRDDQILRNTQTSKMQTADTLHNPRTIVQSGIPMRTNNTLSDGYQRDHRQRLHTSDPSNMETFNTMPNPRSSATMGTNKAVPDGHYKDNQQRLNSSERLNKQTSKVIPSPRTVVQSSIPMRNNKAALDGYHVDHHQRSGRPQTSSMQMRNTIPSLGTTVQSGIPVRTYKGESDDYQMDQRHRTGRPEISIKPSSHNVPSSRTTVQQDFVANANRGNSHRHHLDQQQRYGRSEISNPQATHSSPNTRTIIPNELDPRAHQGSTYGYQRDYQHNFEISGTSAVQSTQSIQHQRTTRQDDNFTRTNLSEADNKIDREKLLNDLGDILLEELKQQEQIEEEMSSGGASDGSYYDYEDSWDMDTSESPVDTNDIGTQFDYADEGISQESISSLENEIQYLIEGSDETFRSSDNTFDVCTQVSVLTSPKANGTPTDACPREDKLQDKNQTSIKVVNTDENREETHSITQLTEEKDAMKGNQSSKESKEDIVPVLNHPDSYQEFTVDVNGVDALDKLVNECNGAVVERPERAPEPLSEVDEALTSSNTDLTEAVGESVPYVKASHDISQLDSSGSHHDGMLGKPTPIQNSDANEIVKDTEQTIESFPQADETSKGNNKVFDNIVVDKVVPGVGSARHNSELCAIVADHDDVFTAIAAHLDDAQEKLTYEKDISERTNNKELLIDSNIHISGNDIKSDHVDPSEQSVDATTQDQIPIESQAAAEKEVEEEILHLEISHDVQSNADCEQSEGVEILTQEIINSDLVELDANNDLPICSDPPSALHISEGNEYDHTDLLTERDQDQESYRLDDPTKTVVEEVVQSLKRPHDEKELNDVDRRIALKSLSEELYNVNNPKVSAEYEGNLTTSDGPISYDDKTTVEDHFCKTLTEDSNQQFDLSSLSSPVEEGNPDLPQTNIIAVCEDSCNGSNHVSYTRKEEETKPNENIGRVSLGSDNSISGNDFNPPQSNRFSFSTPVENKNEFSEEKSQPLQEPSGDHDSLIDEEKSDTDPKKRDQFSDDLKCQTNITVKETVGRESLSPRRSKIPVPKSTLTRSNSLPTRNRMNQDHVHTKGALNNGLVNEGSPRVDINTTSPTSFNSFSFVHKSSPRSASKTGKQQNSRIPIPTSNFKRMGSCPDRSRPKITGLNSVSLSNRSKVNTNIPVSKKNTSKTRSRDINVTEALAINEDARATASFTDVEQSPGEWKSGIHDSNDPSISSGDMPVDLAADDKQSLDNHSSETDDFIKRAKQILSRIPDSPTNTPVTQNAPFEVKSSDRGDKVQEPTEELPDTDHQPISSNEKDAEFLSLEAEADDDTASETLTLHSENDFDIKSPLHDEVLRIELSEIELIGFEYDSQKSPNSRIPIPQRPHKPDHIDALSEEGSVPDDEVVSDVSGRERSIARISPMPREDGGDVTPIPKMRKSFKSRIPLPSPIAIKPPPRTNRNRSYSETDGGNVSPHEEFDEVRQEESDESDETERDHQSEFEEGRNFRRTQSSREVRPRGSYWAFKNTPNLAVSDFERSQTLRPSRSRSTGRKSPAGTPRITPRGTPRSTPRSTPRDTPRSGTLKRQQPHSKSPPTFKSRECAFVPLPEWNRLREVLSSGEQSRQSTRPSSPSEFSYTSRRSSNEFPRMHSPRWETPITTPKPSRWRVDGRVPAHLKKKYSSMNDMGDSKDLYPSDQDLTEPNTVKEEFDSPWNMQFKTNIPSSQSLPRTDRNEAGMNRAHQQQERQFPDNIGGRGRSPCASETTEIPMSSTGDVSAIWTEDDTLQSSNFSLPAGAKKKSWKRRLSIRKKKSVDPSKEEEGKEPEENKREKKKRRNWLLRFLGIRK